MAGNVTKLRNLLAELFMFEFAELDFGIYRIMNSKRAEIQRFLDQDLLPQVRTELGKVGSGERAGIEADLAKLIQQAEALGTDPEPLPKVKALRERLAAADDPAALEDEVFSLLAAFFRRYYKDGDYLALRRYKKDVYALPYEGEEVKLHWANADQYYIKSSEYFRDYVFKLPDGRRVHFKLTEADSEQNNNKAAGGKERRFVLVEQEPLVEEDGELFIRFVYRIDPEKQATLNKAAAARILAVAGEEFPNWLDGLRTKAPTEKDAGRTLLEKHLGDYTARNSFDYFIHKDLRGFLRRELDFFIKSEVMLLDDIEEATAPRVEHYLAKVRAMRRIAHKIIDMLAQLEEFQKRLWLKKKFVVETNYCVTLDRVPEELYPEIAANEAQREEWVRLFAIDAISGDLLKPGYSAPLTVDFLKANPFLVLDTRFFAPGFKARLLASFDDLDNQLDGLLVHSENFQALNLLQERYRGQVPSAYIDPPYNKLNDASFAYKDNYKHSSWITMILDRLQFALNLMSDHGVLFASIDEHEVKNLSILIEQISGFDASMIIPAITNLKGNYDAEGFVSTHEYLVVAAKNALSDVHELPIDEEKIDTEWTEDEYGLYKIGDGLRRTGADASRLRRPKGWFPVFVSEKERIIYVTNDDEPLTAHDIVIWPVNDSGEELSWTWSKTKITQEAHNLLLRGEGREISIYKKQRPGLSGIPTRKARSFLYSPEYSSTNGGNLVQHLFGERMSEFTPKSVKLIQDICLLAGGKSLILDYFAGSGTTGHAVINLNREDGGNRKYILVEMGAYFDTVLKPRILKVIYSKDWKDGKPVSREGSSHLLKYIRLESYEDALNNLEMQRSELQTQLLANAPELREDYMLRYMLDVESRGSASLLNIAAFAHPFDYTLKIAAGSVGETRDTAVDLVETFNYLLGLRVRQIDTIRGVVTVKGLNPEGQRVLIIWRDVEQLPNSELDTFFQKQGYTTRDQEFDLIYVNGDNNLENLRRDDETWKVRLTEQEFQRLMFDVRDV
jgi:adenine-specific DNA-methyltransferase